VSNPRKPTRLHVLTGTFRKDRHGGRRNEPRYAPMRGSAPAWVGRHGRALWRRIAPALVAEGVLTEADRAIFETFCALYGALREAVAAGAPLPLKATAEFRHHANALGLTPSARSKVSGHAPRETGDALDLILGDKK
jgi:phage terminase small subunit